MQHSAESAAGLHAQGVQDAAASAAQALLTEVIGRAEGALSSIGGIADNLELLYGKYEDAFCKPAYTIPSAWMPPNVTGAPPACHRLAAAHARCVRGEYAAVRNNKQCMQPGRTWCTAACRCRLPCMHMQLVEPCPCGAGLGFQVDFVLGQCELSGDPIPTFGCTGPAATFTTTPASFTAKYKSAVEFVGEARARCTLACLGPNPYPPLA